MDKSDTSKKDDSGNQPKMLQAVRKRVHLDSSAPDHLSMKSDESMIQPVVFSQGEPSKHLRVHLDSSTPDHLSMKSDESMIQPVVFSQGEPSKHLRVHMGSSTPDHLSMKSEESMIQPVVFTQGEQSQHSRVHMGSSTPDHLSMKSEESMIQPVVFSQGEQPKHSRAQMDSPTPDHLSMKSKDSTIQSQAFSQELKSKDWYWSREQVSNWLYEELLKCSVCAKLLKDPVSTSCGHSHCRTCITTYQAQSQYGESACPKCGKTSSSFSVLHPNTPLAELIEKFKPTQFGSAGAMKTGDINLNLCQEHCKALAIFCITDKIAICKDCAVQDHREHEKQYIKIPTVPDTATTLQNILGNMTPSEFREFKRNLCHEYPECFQSLEIDCSAQHLAERMTLSFPEDQVLKVTFQLASVKQVLRCQEKIKEKLRKKFNHIREGLALPKTQAVLHDIYTELYITEGGSDAPQNEHEIRLIEKAAKNLSGQETPVKLRDIFKSPSEPRDIRMVLTKGIAGIGKTVSVQKFILDWAENNANQDIDLILPLFFRDLNLEKKERSLMELLQGYFPELNAIETIENGIKILIVLDGLDECRFSLDFQNTRNCHSIVERASVDVLLTNLIRGNLLPNALIWITSRPAAINQIPSQCVERVTEVRGFSNPQIEEYFRRKCNNSDLANRMIKHVKSSRSIHVMCHIPIFCWIMATVLDILLKDTELGEIPENQTQLYTHYLLIQTGLKNRRYQKALHEDLRKMSEDDKKMILNLAKLAFQELLKGNLIFYEDDLKECGIDISEASDFSSMCTQLFREEYGLYREQVFCFLHLCVQEHLAALHVLCTYLNEGNNVLESHNPKARTQQTTLTDVLKSAVVKALQSKNGHFDQFLRFLFGLSVESNQKLLRELLQYPQKLAHKSDEIVSFIKSKIIEEDVTKTAAINLFHCLNEMNNNWLVKDIQKSVDSGAIFEKELKPEECEALVFVCLMSEDVVEVFDLRKYKTESRDRQRLLPIIRTSKKAILSGCKLSEKACDTVASALRIGNSPLKEVDLSNNSIQDLGVKHLCQGLKSPHCRLEILRLGACNLTGESCNNLAPALSQNVKSYLKELDLSFNNLTDSGMKTLEPWLTNKHCELLRLGLRQCNLTKNYCMKLAEDLGRSHTKQIDVDLEENGMEDKKYPGHQSA